MSPLEENPCKDGLTPECFEKYPEFAKKAFAIRLLCLLANCEITSTLPGRLGKLLSIPEWHPGYPWPDAPFWWDTITMPEYARKTGALSPMFLNTETLYRTGPWMRPPARYAHRIFLEQCATIDENVWTLSTNGDYVFDVINNRWHYERLSGYPIVQLRHVLTGWIRDYNNLIWTYTGVSGGPTSAAQSVIYYTGNYIYGAKINPPATIKLRETSGYVSYSVPDFSTRSIVVKVETRGPLTSLRVDGQYIAQDKDAGATSINPGRLTVSFADIMECYFDTLEIWI